MDVRFLYASKKISSDVLLSKSHLIKFTQPSTDLTLNDTRIYNLSSGPHITHISAVVAKKRKYFE